MTEINTVFDQPGARFVLLPAGEKKPPIEKDWEKHPHTFQEALNHIGNIGIMAGEGFIGIDQDAPEAFKNISFPDTTTWETRPGRYGMWFRCIDVFEALSAIGKKPDMAQIKLFKDGKPCGEIKTGNSYQVIPPSWKFVDGARTEYRLVRDAQPASISLVDLLHAMERVGIKFSSRPDLETNAARLEKIGIEDRLRRMEFAKYGTSTEAYSKMEKEVSKGVDRYEAYVLKALEDECERVMSTPKGNRNNTLNESAFKIGTLLGWGVLDESVAKRKLIQAGCGAYLDSSEAERTVLSGIESGKARPRPKELPDDATPQTPQTTAGNATHDINTITEEELNAWKVATRPKFKVNLPPENYIVRYMGYGAEISDAYDEYWFAGALFHLAVAADKKFYIVLAGDEVYPTVYIMMLGDSSLARKTTVVSRTKKVLEHVDPEITIRRIPNEFSPEAFIEHMSGFQHAPWIRDEAAGALSAMTRDYMKGFKDSLMELYDCSPISRKLRTKKNTETTFDVSDPYLNIFWATTPASFAANTTLNDTLSGFLARFLFFFPDGEKDRWMPIKEGRETTGLLETVIKSQLKAIHDTARDLDRTMMSRSKEAAEIHDQWQREREHHWVATKDGNAQQIYSRLNIYAVKLAMLFELGQPGFDPSRPIRKEFMAEACRLVDEYFMQTALDAFQKVGENAERNVIDRVVSYLRKHGGKATQREVLRSTKIKLKDFNEYIESMVESGAVTKFSVENRSGRPTIWICLNASKSDTNSAKSTNVSIVTTPLYIKPENKVTIKTKETYNTYTTFPTYKEGNDGKEEIENSPEPPRGQPTPVSTIREELDHAKREAQTKEEHFAEVANRYMEGKKNVEEQENSNKPSQSDETKASIRSDPSFAAFKEKINRRKCVLCGRGFPYDLTRYDSKGISGYVCTTCLMQGPPPAKESTTQGKLNESME
jgi:hypothetical protein